MDWSKPQVTLRTLVGTLLCAVAATCALSVSAADGDSSRPVASVVVNADEEGRSREVRENLDIVVGRPLDRAELRRRIRAMYASGEVDTLRVEAEHRADGLAIVVWVSYTPLVKEVKVEASRVWRRRVLDWLDVRPGSKVSTGRIEAGVRRATRRVRERGYSQASLEPDLQFDRVGNTVRLILSVDLGEPLRLQTVSVLPARGQKDVSVDIEFKADDVLTDRLEEDLRRLAETELRRQGYWEAVAVGSERKVDNQAVDLKIMIDPGERYRLDLECPDEATELVRSVLPDPGKDSLHPAQTNVIAEMVRERLQADGYLLAEVSAELEAPEEERVLRIAVDPKGRCRIAGVVFDGAASLPDKLLHRTIQVHSGKLGGWRGQEVTTASLERDRRAIADLYQERGFADVLVENAQLERIDAESIRVVFRVHESLRWSLGDVHYIDFPFEVAWAIEEAGQSLNRTGPWDERRVERTRLRLESALASSGYPDGDVSVDLETLGPGLVEVTFRADAGPYVRFGEVVVAGLKRTKKKVVEDVLNRAGIFTGEPWSLDAMLTAQRELYALGLFRRVEFVSVPGDASRDVRSLVLRCEEGEQRSYLAGVGWDTVSKARLTLGWSHLNVLGGAHAFSTEVRWSSREQRFQMSLHEARLPVLGVPGYLVAYRTEEELATYSQRRGGLWFEVGDRRKRPWRPWLRYEFQIVRPDAPDEVKSELERREQEVKISSITPTIEWDTRDDFLSPTRGVLARASLEYAFPLFEANVEFLKLQSNFTIHHQTRRGIAAAGIRLGAINPLGPDTGEAENLQIPINSRFFGGGPSTHRAFRIDFLGIPGQTLDEGGDPIGGNALLVVNLEYQRRVKGPISAVVFLDGGNVWSEPSLVRLEDMRWGLGFGLRYETPAGPLRAEYCWKLDQEPHESGGEFFFSFGIPF